MSVQKEVGSVSHPNPSTNDFLEAVHHYMDELGWSIELLTDRYRASKSTLYKKKGRANRKLISMLTLELVRGFNEQGKEGGLGHKEHVNIMNSLLGAAGLQPLEGGLWNKVHQSNILRVGYTNASPLIERQEGSEESPVSEVGVVGFTEAVASLLGVTPRWIKVPSFSALIESLVDREIDLIAPFLRRIPARHDIDYSQECGRTEKISAIFETDQISGSVESLRRAEWHDRTFDSLLKEAGGPLGYLGLTELVYIQSEVGEHVAGYLKQQVGISQQPVRSTEEAMSRLQNNRNPSVLVVGEEKRRRWITKNRWENYPRKSTLTFQAVEDNVNQLFNSLGYAVPSEQDELLERINMAIEAAEPMEKFERD